MRVIAECELQNGATALAVMGLLKDGTNWAAITWGGGQRFCRTSPDTDWALEERFTSRQPKGADRKLIQSMWRVVVDSMADARKATEAERADGYPSAPASLVVLSNDDALDRAFAMFREESGADISREDFELCVEALAAQDLEDGRSS